MTAKHGDGTERSRKETVTMSFITNFEIDPEEFDLRVTDPDKVRDELFNAVTGKYSIQEPLGNSEREMERHRKRIKEAREGDDS